MKSLKICLLSLIVFPLSVTCLNAVPGIYADSGRIYEQNGAELVLRGINVPHTWWTDYTEQGLADIAETGANSVRVVLSSGDYLDKKAESGTCSKTTAGVLGNSISALWFGRQNRC